MKVVIDIPEEAYKGVLELWKTEKDSRFKNVIHKAIVNGRALTTGYWIYKNNCWHCSECGVPCKTIGYVGTAKFMHDNFKFCNHCGATMTGGEIRVNDEQERPTGHWFLLDECSNEGVYCSNCRKKVYRVEYANQKMKSNFCPNCGADMREEAYNER